MASHDHDALVVALDAADRAIDHPGHDLLPSGRRAAAHGLAAAGRQRIYDLTGDVTVLDESLRSLAIACDLADDDDPHRLG
ncbi:MAG: hypothetical protein OEV40_14765 [Acidimicrobiia bacterium]|nr:hypothetical protein [Acidimicrobiia bacterium]